MARVFEKGFLEKGFFEKGFLARGFCPGFLGRDFQGFVGRAFG